MANIRRILLRAFFLVSWLCLLAVSSFAQQQDGGIVQSIQVQGNQRVDSATILYYIKTKKGDPLSRPKIRKDIEQIYSLGQFEDIRVDTREVPGGVEVIFHVVEIASVGDVSVTGNLKIDQSEILEKIPLRRGSTFHQHLIKESEELIGQLYQEKGYFFADIKIDNRITKENLVDISVRIQEGEKVNVENIRFVGNKHIPDDDLRESMETKEKTWFWFLDDSGIYKKDILKLDMFRVEGYYHDHGFIRVRVLEPKIDVDRANKKINITIPVEEGPQFRVGGIILKGDDTLTEKEIRDAMHLKEGEIYNVSQLRTDVLSITELYSQRGYAYADVNPLTKIDDGTRKVDVTVDIDKGRKVFVGEISIAGNTRTLDNVIRREFRLKEGELFDSTKLKRTKQRINNLQYFEDVKIDTRRGKDPDLIDINTTVTERPTGSFSIGAGFSSVENFIFSASITQDNFLGRGQRLNFSTSLSTLRSDFNLSFTDPRIFDTEITFGVDAFNRDTDFISFDSRNRGAGVRFGKNLTEYDWVGVNYRFDDIKVTDVDPIDEDEFLKNETRITSRISPTFIRDTRDDFLNPSKGWRHVVRFELAGLGGSKFVRTGYEVSYYRPIISKLVGAVHAEVNWADGYGDDKLPAFERYFMGGPQTLRGYTVRDVGPKDVSGDPVGGNQSLLFNFELQYPFTQSLRGFVFYDRGNVYGNSPDIRTTATDFDLSEMRDSIGFGVRFLSPFGPVGFAYGFKLDKFDGEDDGEFHFSAGSAF